MPDVGLFASTKPVPESTPVVIRFSVEVGGLEVYNESYDVETLSKEVEKDKAKALEVWARRLLCVVNARNRPGFSAAVTCCLADGNCCDYGSGPGTKIDERGIPS